MLKLTLVEINKCCRNTFRCYAMATFLFFIELFNIIYTYFYFSLIAIQVNVLIYLVLVTDNSSNIDISFHEAINQTHTL